ncbi:MAG: hypothetical protein HN909_09515, partial [Phycisphaerales bacterium]|nr:hypothetical protein [Phycisphaerales bacterium]
MISRIFTSRLGLLVVLVLLPAGTVAGWQFAPAALEHLATTELTASTGELVPTAPPLPVPPLLIRHHPIIPLAGSLLGLLAVSAWCAWVLRSSHAKLNTPPKPADRLLLAESIAKAAGVALGVTVGFLSLVAALHTTVLDRWTTANRFWELLGHTTALI